MDSNLTGHRTQLLFLPYFTINAFDYSQNKILSNIIYKVDLSQYSLHMFDSKTKTSLKDLVVLKYLISLIMMIDESALTS